VPDSFSFLVIVLIRQGCFEERKIKITRNENDVLHRTIADLRPS